MLARILHHSPAEILFRLRQEAANVWLRWGPAPVPGIAPVPLPLPRPEAFLSGLAGTRAAAQIVTAAEASLRREFSLLGYTVRTGRTIHWRRDYVHDRETGLAYFRSIPYLDATLAGDHKIIWELNRHQHLTAMAQAFLLTGRQEFLDDLWYQLETWLEQNPFCRGMNWTSALEVAFRALSWIWIEHWTGQRMPAALRPRWLESLFQHGRYLENNLSVYFSPNTHLQGEALALHALGVLFDRPGWRQTGAALLHQMIVTHVRDDGSHFEQSSYYHVYALDMFLLHALFEPPAAAYRDRLRRMAEYLWALSSSGEIPLLGDDDGGRLFHPFGNRRAFGRATLASCAVLLGDTPWHGDPQDLPEQAAWWFGTLDSKVPAGQHAAQWFPDAGIAVLSEGGLHLLADTRGFGHGSAGHSHAHALHCVLRRGNVDVLLDPGTYTYVADPLARERFRGTAAHNTVGLDSLDQATPAGPFRWIDLPVTETADWSASPWSLRARCRYRGCTHERQWAWISGVLFVLDRIEGAGEHKIEQRWHVGGPAEPLDPGRYRLPAGVTLLLPLAHQTTVEKGWFSTVPGHKQEAPVLRVTAVGSLPCLLPAAFVMEDTSSRLYVEDSALGVILTVAGRRVEFFNDPAKLPAEIK